MGACGSSQVQPGDIETDPIGKGPLAGAAARACRRPQTRVVATHPRARPPAPADIVRQATVKNPWLGMLSTPQLVEIKQAFAQFGARCAPPPTEARLETTRRAAPHVALSPPLFSARPRAADRDGDGHIDPDELSTVMGRMGMQPTDAQLKELIESVDFDNNGKIEFEEFATLMARRMLISDGDYELKQAFKIFDADESGKLDVAEVRAMFTHNNNPFNPQARRPPRPPARRARRSRPPAALRARRASRDAPPRATPSPPPLTPHPSTAAEPRALRDRRARAPRRPRWQRLGHPRRVRQHALLAAAAAARPPAQDASKAKREPRRRRREHLRRGRRFARVVRALRCGRAMNVGTATVGARGARGGGRHVGYVFFTRRCKNSGLWRHKRSSPGGTRSRRAHALRRRRRAGGEVVDRRSMMPLTNVET